jgi:hypothetical protein
MNTPPTRSMFLLPSLSRSEARLKGEVLISYGLDRESQATIFWGRNFSPFPTCFQRLKSTQISPRR